VTFESLPVVPLARFQIVNFALPSPSPVRLIHPSPLFSGAVYGTTQSQFEAESIPDGLLQKTAILPNENVPTCRMKTRQLADFELRTYF